MVFPADLWDTKVNRKWSKSIYIKMNKIKNSLFVARVLAFPALFISGVSVTLAAVTQPISAPVNTTDDIKKLMCNIIGWFVWFMIVISVIMVLVAAFDYITAGDDTEKTTRGRKRLTYAAIGIIIALLAFVFPTIISSLFSGVGLFTLNTSTCST